MKKKTLRRFVACGFSLSPAIS